MIHGNTNTAKLLNLSFQYKQLNHFLMKLTTNDFRFHTTIVFYFYVDFKIIISVIEQPKVAKHISQQGWFDHYFW